jgi:NHL repeat-containing protein
MIARWLARFASMSLCALVGALAFVVSPAGAAQTRRVLDSFGGVSSSVVDPYPLSDPQGVAVDEETEDVYVADAGNHRVEKFSATGQFLLAFGGNVGGPGVDVCGGVVACVAGSEGSAPGEFTDVQYIVVDNDSMSPSYHDVYVADAGDGIVSKFSPEGKLEESWGTKGQLNGSTTMAGSFGTIAGVAVGATGTLYVVNSSALRATVFEFEPGSEFVREVSTEEAGPGGLAVNAGGDLLVNYVTYHPDFLGQIFEYGPTGGFLGYVNGGSTSANVLTSNPGGELYFAGVDGTLDHDDFNAGNELVEPEGRTCSLTEYHCTASDITRVGFVGSGIAAAAGGDTYLADAAEGKVYRYGPLVTAVPPEEPRSEQAVEVKAASAKLQGVLNANTTEGESDTYEFLYRQSASECEGEGSKTTPVTPTQGRRGETVSAVVGELVPGAVYTFCLRVSNGAGETALGASVHFTTLPVAPGVEGLSVSDVAATSATLNASVKPGGGASYVFEYAPAGGSFAPVPGSEGQGSLTGGAPVTVSAHLQGLLPASAYQFRVSASNSAGSFVSAPALFTTQATGGGFVLPDGRQWELVSPADKHGAEILPIGDSVHVQAAVGGDAMTFEATVPTESDPPGYSSVELEQVLSVRGPDGWSSRDISPPTDEPVNLTLGGQEGYVAFSEDLSLAVLQQPGRLDPLLSPGASEQTPYLRTNFVNGNVNDPCTESCYRPLVSGCPAKGEPCAKAVEEHANVLPGTMIDEAQKCHLCGPLFSGATLDLSHIAFKNENPLLPGAGKDEEYEWVGGQLSRGSHLPERRVSRSVDGSWSYFVSAEALAAGAQPEQCGTNYTGVGGDPGGLCNLYVSHGGVTRLVAVLSDEDFPDWRGRASGSAFGDELDGRTSRVSPDGRWFAFMSQRELTGYDTHDAVSGQPDEEVYLYHAPEDLASEAGALVCASCDPTGARPVGFRYGRYNEPGTLLSSERALVSGAKYFEPIWEENQWLAANVPGWTGYGQDESAVHQSRYLSDGGRLFFNSSDALVPKDVNGNEDVYEYEPVGVGGCTASTSTGSSTYVPARGGCVSLISSGQDAGESAFLDASETGGDVFFLTAAKLAPQDVEGGLSIFDARECTAQTPCYPAAAAVPPPCETGDACKPAPTPQPTDFGSAPSATFNGPGNITPEVAPPPKKVTKKTVKCGKGSVKSKRGKCVRTKSKKTKKAKKASHNGRTKS